MSNHAPYLDTAGIRHDPPAGPQRYPVDRTAWQALTPFTAIGRSGSMRRRAWENLIRVHGVSRVRMAVAAVITLFKPDGDVSPEAAKDVLDGYALSCRLCGCDPIERHPLAS